MKKLLQITFCLLFMQMSFGYCNNDSKLVGTWISPRDNVFITFFNNNKLSIFSPAVGFGQNYRYYLLDYELSENGNYLTLSDSQKRICGKIIATQNGNLKLTAHNLRLIYYKKEFEFRPIGMNGKIWLPKEDINLRNTDPLITNDKKVLYDFDLEYPRYSEEEERQEWGLWDAALRNANMNYKSEAVVYVYEFDTGIIKKGKYNYEYGRLQITFKNEKPIHYSVSMKTDKLIEFREEGGKAIYLTNEESYLTWESKRGWEALVNLSKPNEGPIIDENAIKAGVATALLYLIFAPSESNSDYYQDSRGTYHSDPRINSYMRREHEAESRNRY